ncbi:MAG: hypothetical protein RMJ43_09435 [Chloroherpetonaceae bacterium]|nr:hypothetical protein [Chthonomonadaceae bacterium]MDW8208046.1 hypothetical protein [Chloroherpetonaceae bacterium]
MRKPDVEVREVVCSETGKPMPKIPLWLADVKVKFVCEEARQRHGSSYSFGNDVLRHASYADDEDPKADMDPDMLGDPDTGDLYEDELEADEPGMDLEEE